MNPTHVYAKTEAGEDAVVQRTRLVQRNLRTVLILVDGKSTVEDLVVKVGSAEMVNLALDQLEKDGFIRRVGSGGQREKPNAPAAAESRPAEPPAPSPKAAVEVETNVETLAKSPFPAIAPAPEKPTLPASPFGATTPAQPSVSPFSMPAAELSMPPFGAGAPAAAPAGMGSPFQAPSGSSPFAGASPFGSAPAPAAPPVAERAPPPERVVAAAEEVSRPPRRKSKLLTPGVLAGTFGGLLVLLALVFLFFPYGSYQGRVEAALSAAVGQPVKVGSLSATFAPEPTLVLSQVRIGEGAQISVSEVRAVPSLASLLIGRKSFRRIELQDATVPMEQLGLLASGLGAAAKGDAFSIGGIDFTRITIGLRDISLAGYSGRAEMTSDGGLRRMALVSPDQTLRLSVETKSGGAQVAIEGQGWKPGENSPFVFDSLSINGEMTGTRLQVQKVEGRIFGGVIQGQFALDWANGMAVTGDVSVDYMSAASLANALGTGKIAIEGQANARVRFRAAGASWNALVGKVPLDGDVILKAGALNGLDLVEAVRRGSKLAMRGGTTRFEQATGKFRWDGQALQLTDIDLGSGLVRATGNLGVLKSGQMSGVLNVVLRGSAATVSTPVSVVGTLNDPQLFGGRR